MKHSTPPQDEEGDEVDDQDGDDRGGRKKNAKKEAKQQERRADNNQLRELQEQRNRALAEKQQKYSLGPSLQQWPVHRRRQT